ncbi:MAG TPA: protein-L-isoaspartate O-methyltransferase [Caulobacteraceae bacterium]|nr:protein-L-isoaspartate O-methyltransferase [Caulobacteraceae bacterium]
MSADLAAERATMVESQVRTSDVTDLAIQDAMRIYPRERLLPEGRRNLAYADAEIAYAPGRWLLRPMHVAKLLQALKPRSGETALAIAAPYAAEILALLGLSVTRLEEGDLKHADGSFDVIACEGAVGTTPESWKTALAPGGRLGVIERDGPVGRAMLYLRAGSTIGSRSLFDCTPPVMAGFETVRGFTL